MARSAGASLLLETPTWRASGDWGQRLGYDAVDLARVNAEAVAFLRDVVAEHAVGVEASRCPASWVRAVTATSATHPPPPGGRRTTTRRSSLPSSLPAIDRVDTACLPDHYVVNCAHPDHVVRGLAGPGAWRERIEGVRFNASTLSHAELDEATTLDDGDPSALAASAIPVVEALPRLRVIGGCCGTDARHVAALWGVPAPD